MNYIVCTKNLLIFHLETVWMLFEFCMLTLWHCDGDFWFQDVKNEIYLLIKFSATIFIKPLCLSVKLYLLNRFLILLTKVWCIKTPNISPNFSDQLWIIILQLNPKEFLWERSNYNILSKWNYWPSLWKFCRLKYLKCLRMLVFNQSQTYLKTRYDMSVRVSVLNYRCIICKKCR
jgi:hypothetical protein